MKFNNRSITSFKQWLICLITFIVCNTVTFAQTNTLTKAQYRDKTLAMILGSVGGVTTGYEYLNVYNTPNGYYAPGATQKVPKEPLLGMPDDWFILLNGTLGGTTKDEYNYGSWFTDGRMNSDDDQCNDFFNQYLMNQYSLSITYEDIKNEWMSKQVSDYGGGEGAIEVMRDKNLMAPQCGNRNHGNSGYWLAESYIEHEMMGAAFPGMPNKTSEYAERFSHITGEGENVQWGCYWAVAHSIAFFETDIRVATKKALGMLPGNCRPRQMYDICVALQAKYPTDWRAAVRELWVNDWTAPFAVGYDGVTLVSDPNNGTAMLAILYGNNDYLTTLKIASLAGGDGDCTASTVGGLLGVIKGMAGTPQEFKDRIYQNGKGLWINDVAHAFSIKANYQIEWTYDELVDMYQRNAESAIRAFGGTVTGTGYTIKTQSGIVSQVFSSNWDFEKGDLSGWKTWTGGGGSSMWAEKQCDSGTQACFAGTGKYKGTVTTGSATSEAKLYQTITGLKPGATYKIEGRINTATNREARFYVENYGGVYKYTSIWQGITPFPYMYLYVTMGASNTTLDVGLHAPPTTNGSTWCSIDDIIIKEVENPSVSVIYEAENATVNKGTIYTNTAVSGGKYVGGLDATDSYIEFPNITANYTGEYILRINFANAGAYAQQQISVNGNFIGLLEHSDSGPWGKFSANATDAYVKLNKGNNVVRIVKSLNTIEIDYVELLSPYGAEGKPDDASDLVDGGIYKIVNKKSQKVLDVNGAIANGSLMVENTFTGAQSQYFKLTKTAGLWYLSPLNSTQSVEVQGSGTNNGDKLGLWGYWAGDNQKWAILDVGSGYFQVLNNNSGKAMDVSGGSTADGATVFQWDYLNGDNQQWRFDFVGTNTTNLPQYIPGRIEAENYTAFAGIQKETTSDTGTGQDVGFIENGDWIEYTTYVNKAGKYTFTFRTASATAGGNIVLSSGNTTLATVAVTGTDGWQTWKTTSADITLPTEGLQTIRLTFTGATGSLFNINWFEAQLYKDCAGVESGTATIDACSTCVGGTTGKTTLDTDKDGLADCVDPDDDNDGILDIDDCAPLDPAIKGKTTWYADTDGDGFGDPTVTQVFCSKPAGYVADKTDACPADPNKKAAGNCGCGKTEQSCLDCSGIANGTAKLDACGVCTGGTTGKTTLDTDKDGLADCVDPDDDNDGVLDADDCAPLDPVIKGKTTWYADTDGDGFGDPTVTQVSCSKPAGYVADKTDTCPSDANKKVAGNCGCGKTEQSCINIDCAGTPNGTAKTDACGVCVGGTTGKITLDTDKDGLADCVDPDDDNDGVLDADDCDPLNAAITIKSIWYEDVDSDGFGDPSSTLFACAKPSGYVANKTDVCPTDPDKESPGNCGCNKVEQGCMDCAGVANGTAVLDNCQVCVGGTTGKTACTKDCNGDFGGTATIDVCNICSGGNTDIIPKTNLSQCTTTGINSPTAAYITVIPQPFENTTLIKITSGEITGLTIVDARGSVVYNQTDLHTDHIDVGETLTAGMYTVIVYTENAVSNVKILKLK